MCNTCVFLRCKHCGNLVGLLHDGGVPLICCGEPMQELVANTVEASAEKHLPVVEIEGNQVKIAVGSVPHPMLEAHYIEWIYLLTCSGGHRKRLLPGDKPEALFLLAPGEKPVAAYEYCNLHSLWKTEIK